MRWFNIASDLGVFIYIIALPNKRLLYAMGFFFSENRSISIYNNAEVCVVVIGKRNDEVFFSLLLFVLHAIGWLIIKLVWGGFFFSSLAEESGLE